MFYIEYCDKKFVRQRAQNFLGALEQSKFFIKNKKINNIDIRDSKTNLYCHWHIMRSLNDISFYYKQSIDYIVKQDCVFLLLVNDYLSNLPVCLYIDNQLQCGCDFLDIYKKVWNNKNYQNGIIKICDKNYEYFLGDFTKFSRGHYGKK